ncbi:alpha/beta hydrolase [Paenibacillus anaericanus]|uniref:Alpha/beta hydrolase n=1 Tax=Paenibacillus anaericanus TaxID=170367 RepID=A0A3S1DH51_9BACL|nr:alpha/beta hydrolase [Paenibacillus anaericanus]
MFKTIKFTLYSVSNLSYHFFEGYSNLSTGLLIDDLLELTDYVIEKFGQDKVLLVGHSFGTYIGIQAAVKAPYKFAGYIGIGHPAPPLIIMNYRKILLKQVLVFPNNLARHAQRSESVTFLVITHCSMLVTLPMHKPYNLAK